MATKLPSLVNALFHGATGPGKETDGNSSRSLVPSFFVSSFSLSEPATIEQGAIMRIFLTLCVLCSGALCGPLRASDETRLILQIAPEDGMAVDLGWSGQEITGLRLVDWTENVGGVLKVRGTSGQERDVVLTLLDGRLVVRTGKVDEDSGPVDPPVVPTVPDGHLGLTRSAFDWVNETVKAADPEWLTHARDQAGNYAQVATGLIATPPKYTTVTAAFESLRILNRAALPAGAPRDAWAAFSARVQKRIESLWPFDQQEAGAILGAIGDGLRAVR